MASTFIQSTFFKQVKLLILAFGIGRYISYARRLWRVMKSDIGVLTFYRFHTISEVAESESNASYDNLNLILTF